MSLPSYVRNPCTLEEARGIIARQTAQRAANPPKEEPMNEHDFQNLVHDALLAYTDDGVHDVRSFDDAGLMTRDEGLVVRMDDGAEFQLTIVQAA